jgi:hypothetical protein
LVLAAAMSALVGLSTGCGGQSSSASGSPTGSAVARTPGQGSQSSTAGQPPAPLPVRHLSSVPVVSIPSYIGRAWRPVATVREQVAAWIAQRSGVTLMRFDQSLARLALHAGSAEPGGSGWRYGAQIGPHEVHRVLAGFNGGFKLTYGSVGFFAGGRTPVALSVGLGSIVTYRDGSTQIGAWREGVPATGKPLASVRQNLHLLVDHGLAASTVEGCVSACWGSTLGGGTSVARSALGIDAVGRLVWAAGESLSPAQLADALVAAGVQRAVELDINPFWVAGYLYVHHPGGPSAVPVVPGQHGIAGQLLEPNPRDFFTVLAR